MQTISRPIGAWTANWNDLPHNHEIRWPYVFVSGYEDGLEVFNMQDPAHPRTVGYYRTYDGPHAAGIASALDMTRLETADVSLHGGRGGVLNGAWGVAVRNADGLIVISDMTTGFWALHMDGFDEWNGHDWGMPNISSAQDWDNGPDGAPKPIRVGEYRRTHHPDRLGSELTAMRSPQRAEGSGRQPVDAAIGDGR